jgi:hypothetical protein
MTPGALSGRTDKNPLYMAGFATHQGMFEIQRESGVVMIEIGANLKRGSAAGIKSAQHQQSHQGKAQF